MPEQILRNSDCLIYLVLGLIFASSFALIPMEVAENSLGRKIDRKDIIILFCFSFLCDSILFCFHFYCFRMISLLYPPPLYFFFCFHLFLFLSIYICCCIFCVFYRLLRLSILSSSITSNPSALMLSPFGKRACLVF